MKDFGTVKKPLVIITGPTASGKSSVGVELAARINAAVVSADSVQIYKGMNIGSAKIAPEEMKGVKHYLISELNPNEEFNVNVFVKFAEAAIEKIYAEEKVPILVGGTAFYIQALLKGVEFDESAGADEEFRRECEAVYESPSKEEWENFTEKYLSDKLLHPFRVKQLIPSDVISAKKDEKYPLYGLLREIDSEYACTLHPNNHKRVIRSLEYYKATGEKYSDYNKREEGRASRFKHHYFVLEDDREILYERINKRVDEMIAEGLEEEVRGLLAKGYGSELKSMQSIGYKEMCSYISGACSHAAAVEAIKQNTRHFAKRQMTWFRREKDVIPIDIKKFGYNTSQIAEYIRKRI